MKPYTTIEEINQEWQHIKNENIQDIDLKVLAIDNNTLIAEWLLKQNNQELTNQQQKILQQVLAEALQETER